MSDLYATPRSPDLADCYFYHTMDLPGVGTVPGTWDLRAGGRAYLGRVDVAEGRVLDVGAASGFLSFTCEAWGAAEVVSYDLDERGDWDMVPYAAWTDYAYIAAERKKIIRRLNNAYWLAHRALGSRARMVYGSIYAIPETIGPVDVAIYGSVLLHVRDPFLALQNGARLAREALVVAEVLRGLTVPSTEPTLGFLPDPVTLEPKDTWWDLRPEVITRMCGVLGFPRATVTTHTQHFDGREIECYTVVARR